MMTALNPDYANHVRRDFAKQGLMATLGAEIVSVMPGAVDIAFAPRAELSQQNGFVHAGAVAAVLDSACGYAAVSLMPAGVDALTVEFKINLLRPAAGERLILRGRVIKPGRTLTFCRGECFAVVDGQEKLIATMDNTVMTMRPTAQTES